MTWTALRYRDEAYVYDAERLTQTWARLHAGDVEPFPKKPALADAWIACHAGQFRTAARLGLALGVDGYSVAHKASCVSAAYVETGEKRKLALYEKMAERCERQQADQPDNPAGWYWQALALGIAPKVRAGLEKTIRPAPAHAEAHIALGVYHTEPQDAKERLEVELAREQLEEQ
ncbi:MAG: hypothetical protein JWP34_593 [Massilia sp.]|nr:hypothetical protein [Massilia sp.]